MAEPQGIIIIIIIIITLIVMLLSYGILNTRMTYDRGSRASWKVLESFGKISSPGKSWRMILVPVGPGNLS